MGKKRKGPKLGFRKPKVHVDRRYHAKNNPTIKPTVIVLHTTEGHDHAGTKDVEGVLSYLYNKGYGIHFVVDKDGNLGQGAAINKQVAHCAGANSFSIGIEMIGFAKFNLFQWNLRKKQLRKVALLLAWLHLRTGIPLERSKNAIAYHRDYPGTAYRWDPGYNFPITRVLRMARKYAKHGWVPQ